MKALFHKLASLKIAVVLLVLLLIGLAAGTILESSRGTEEAGRLVYYAWWFIGLQIAFVVNVAASIATHFPWGKQRVGFLTTHTALLVILAGAGVSYFFKQEAQIELWEGNSTKDLGFSLKLDKFTIDRYPGTMMPANFRSDVEVDGVKQAVWMNHPLEVRGWRLFQSSYRQEQGKSATVLSASKDPGQPIVFFGYGLLVIGMCVVLATRVAATRAAKARVVEARARRKNGKAAIAAGVGLLLLAGGARAQSLSSVRRVPVQHDGRVMPLDTLAREAVWNVTGERSWEGEDPVTTVTKWSSDPQTASTMPYVRIGSAQLVAAAGWPAGTTHATFAQIVSNEGLMQQLQGDTEKNSAAAKLGERLETLSRFFNRQAILPVPADGKWKPGDFAKLAEGPRLEGWPSESSIDREITYNQLRPTRIAWIVLLLAFALSLWGKDRLSFAGLLGGFGVMTWGIATRWSIAGRIPAANMYESLLFLAWGVGLFAVIAFGLLRNKLVVQNATVMAAITMALTDLLPIDGFVHPVPPVLSGTPWLAIHVPIIMVSYSVLALGVVVAHMQVGFTIFAPQKVERIERMNDLLYWYMHVGAILLVTGIMTGSVWAASSWGRYWGWDPKEVWSLVAFLAYIGILHARWDKMLGRFGVAAMSIIAFQTILMTYLGVNFVLTTGMHSYGMGDSPVVMWMIVVALAEAAFLAWGFAAQRRASGLQPTAA